MYIGIKQISVFYKLGDTTIQDSAYTRTKYEICVWQYAPLIVTCDNTYMHVYTHTHTHTHKNILIFNFNTVQLREILLCDNFNYNFVSSLYNNSQYITGNITTQ